MRPTDAELIACIRRQNPRSFEALAARYRDPIHRYLQSMVRDPHTADDLLQEVLLRVWTHAEQWDGRGSVHAWLYRIATNLALNQLRSQRRRRELPFESTATIPGEEEGLMPAWMADALSPGPEEQAEQVERLDRLRRLVDALPSEKREVLRMVFEDELELREVAELLSIPEGTVKSRLHHARKRLARQWHDSEDDVQ